MTLTSPQDFQFRVYTRPTGLGTGTYDPWLLKGASVEVERSLFEGDTLSIRSKRKDRDIQIDKVRPVRFYWKGTKLFDGCIRTPKYDNKQNRFRDLDITAYGWEKELAGIQLDLVSPDGIQYINKSIDFILCDLARIANDMGMYKKAIYVYDTTKLPYYDAAVFGTAITRTYSESIWSALNDLTKELDIAETSHIGEWMVKVDALQSDDYIYLIPVMVNTDQLPVRKFKDNMLTVPKRIRKDYSRLLNYIVVRGNAVLTNKRFGDTPLLPETSITTSPQAFEVTVQPSGLHYLRITVKNPTGLSKGGWVQLWGNNGAAPLYTEQFYVFLPANTERMHFSDKQYAHLYRGAAEGSSFDSVELTSLTGCTVKVEEVFYGVAGKSINEYGVRGKSIRNVDFNTQAKVDSYASQLVRMYHAPLVHVDAVIKSEFANTDELVGKTVRLYDNFLGDFADFVCTKQGYYFEGPAVKEEFSAVRYNYDQDYVD